MYTKYSSDEILDAYITQSQATYSPITKLVEEKIKEGIIIEGYQITPELIHQLTKKYEVENIRAIILTKNKVDDIVETARASKEEKDWFINKTTDPAIHTKIAEMLSKYSDYLESEAGKYNIKTESYSGDFESQINSALSTILGV